MTGTTTICQSCLKKRPTRSAVVAGKYYKDICDSCIGIGTADEALSSNAAGYERRRGYEDNAQDTIQPYDANGKANPEFLRMYPTAASKVFSADQIKNLKRQF